MNLHELHQIEFRLLKDLHLTNIHDREGEDALGGLLDLATDLLGDAVLEGGREGGREGGVSAPAFLTSEKITKIYKFRH